MKNIEIMKTAYRVIISILLMITSFACDTEPIDLVTENANEGGLIEVEGNIQSGSYVVGNSGPYTIELFLNQKPGQEIVNIDLYKLFKGSKKVINEAGEEEFRSYSTNEVLDQTINVSTITGNGYVNIDYTYADLIKSLNVEGENLPETDGLLNIGDEFIFRAVALMKDGREVEQNFTIKFTVSTRYAGSYRAINAEYYRVGVLTFTTADWPNEMVISSVDATTYKVNEYFGPFNGNEWYFQIIDGKILYPEKTPDGKSQTANGQPLITCNSNPSDMTNVPCGPETNLVINDDENGKDQLVMSFGYYTEGSGSREFYQVLEKIK